MYKSKYNLETHVYDEYINNNINENNNNNIKIALYT